MKEGNVGHEGESKGMGNTGINNSDRCADVAGWMKRKTFRRRRRWKRRRKRRRRRRKRTIKYKLREGTVPGN